MTTRSLYLAAYDISRPRCLAAALKLTRAYATGGQKSLHEVFLTPAERQHLIENISALLDLETDCFFLIRLDPAAFTPWVELSSQPLATIFTSVENPKNNTLVDRQACRDVRGERYHRHFGFYNLYCHKNQIGRLK